jgi:hypothetical protein
MVQAREKHLIIDVYKPHRHNVAKGKKKLYNVTG